jgi:adenylate cyclase
MTTAGVACASCGTELPSSAKFCYECGAAVTVAAKPAEYKQVTVLFADVVHSIDIAAAVGAERLREIMTELVNRSAGVVQRYGNLRPQSSEASNGALDSRLARWHHIPPRE